MHFRKWVFAGSLIAGILAAQGKVISAPPADPTPKDVIVAFESAMEKGDEKGTFNQLWFADAASKQEAEAVLGEGFAQQQLDHALQDVFHSKPRANGMGAAAADIRKAMNKATVSETGDTAVVRGGGPPFYLVKKEGQWKIDFDQMQRADPSPRPQKDEFESMNATARVCRDMAAEIRAKKYKTLEEAKAELNQRLARIVPPAHATEAKQTSTLGAMTTLRTALISFNIKYGRYPTSSEGLSALVKEPASLWGKGYKPTLNKLPVDGWGRDFFYRSPGIANPKGFDLYSAGPDGKPDTADDVK